MKRILFAAAAFSALACAATAQPAYDGQSTAPSDYPPCTQPGQDRCMAGGGGGGRHMHMKHMHMKHMKGHHEAKSSKDGERG